jgi:hypothetical protein
MCIHGFYDPTETGNTVAGDGTSTVTCSGIFLRADETGDVKKGT